MIRLIIFDLDGTILDTASEFHRAINILMDRYGDPSIELSTIKEIMGGVGDLIPNLQAEARQERLKEFYEIYQDFAFKETRVYSGILEFLSQWEGQVAIYSNKPVAFVEGHVKGSALSEYPWLGLFGGDSFEEKKPHPMGIEHILKLSGCSPEEAIMIGDSFLDMKAAQAAGVDFVGVTFGYGNIEAMSKEGGQHWIEHYSKLPEQIKSLELKGN